MKRNSWFRNVAVIATMFVLLIGAAGSAVAQGSDGTGLEPPVPFAIPLPSSPDGESPQSPDAGTVTAYSSWTGDSTWTVKDWFFPGESIKYVVGVNNTTGSDRNITLVYTVYGPDGELVAGGPTTWIYNLTTGPGIWSWGIDYVVPAGHGGWHTLVGTVTYNGNTTQATSPGHFVYGSSAYNHLFDDGFEFAGDLSNWSAKKTDNGDLYVTPAATLVGWQGLAAVIDDNKPLYVMDETPWSEWTYSAAFFFDPNSIVMKSGNMHNLFVGRNASGQQVNRLQFRRYGANYQLRAQILKDGSGYVSSPWLTIADGPQRITFGWAAASGPGYNNGGAILGIQPLPCCAGEQWWSKWNVDNDTRRIDNVLLGPSSGIDATTRGTYYLDGFDSWR